MPILGIYWDRTDTRLLIPTSWQIGGQVIRRPPQLRPHRVFRSVLLLCVEYNGDVNLATFSLAFGDGSHAPVCNRCHASHQLVVVADHIYRARTPIMLVYGRDRTIAPYTPVPRLELLSVWSTLSGLALA